MHLFKRTALYSIIFLFLQGCAMAPRNTSSIDLSQIFEPIKDSLVSPNKKPLVFPATVAILMIPPTNNVMVPKSTLHIAAEGLKKELLKNSAFISGVRIINSRDIKGKVSLNTIRDMYGVDILALLSYEQDQRSTQNSLAALLNVAIVPAYAVPSVKLTTSTVVDGKIIHIPSNAIIFRTSGVSERSTYLTPVSTLEGRPNEESIVGLQSAVSDLGNNVRNILVGLKKFDLSNAVSMNELLKDDLTKTAIIKSKNWDKVDAYKRSGGSLGMLGLISLSFICWFYRTNRHSKNAT